MRKKIRFIAAGIVVCCSLTGAAQRPGFLLFTDPGKRFSVEFPKDWKWTIISGSGEPIATFVHPKGEAAVVVEHFRMKQRLSPGDVTDLFAELEVEYVKENQRGVAGIAGRLQTRGGMPSAVIEYTRPGLNEQERVRQFSFPIGEDLYRVTCMALASRFGRYENDFNAIVDTLRPAVALAGGPARP